MRTQTVHFQDGNEDAQISYLSYPEACVFVHSRHVYLKADMRDQNNVPNNSLPVSLTITDSDSNVSYTLAKYTDTNGVAVFDISRLLQILTNFVKPDAMFNYYEDSRLVQSDSITLALSAFGVQFWTGTLEAFDGSDEINDLWWVAPRRVRWWTAYPFTFDYGNVDEAQVQIDGGTSETTSLPDITTTKAVSRLRINPAGGKFSLTANKLIKVLVNSTGMAMDIANGVTGHTNGTSLFLNQTLNTLYIEVCHCDPSPSDVYVRWLNKHGELCYWLFKSHQESRNVTASEAYRAMVEDDRYGTDFVRDTPRLVTRKLSRELTIYTDYLQQWEYEHIASMFDAPFVDVLETNKYDLANSLVYWNRVHLKPGTFSESLKDFSEHDHNKHIVVTLAMPEQSHIEP